jgi:hypothetical protein
MTVLLIALTIKRIPPLTVLSHWGYETSFIKDTTVAAHGQAWVQLRAIINKKSFSRKRFLFLFG